MSRWITLAGFIGLIVVACAQNAEWTSSGYAVCFITIAAGALLEEPSARRNTNGPLIRKPFRYLTGAIALLALIGAAGATYAHLKTDENLLVPILFLITAAFAAGWLTRTGFFPFRTR